MFLNRIWTVILFFWITAFFGQENLPKKDSIREYNIDEVVVTGQLRPQSIKKSVFEVKIITAKQIKQRAVNNLADVLNQTLNVAVYQNSSTGKSEINVLGLGGRYLKVLVDNIPIINEEGFGNNTDLTTINLDDIERVELVEGAMGVQYGANALSGVLNIITKKNSRKTWNITASIQEESVGKEYEWFNQGRHIQSASVGHKISTKDYINLSYTRNDFRGYLDSLQGKYYDKVDRLRGHTWLPKEQNNAKLLFNHKGENVSVFYKFDYFHEDIFSYDKDVALNTNTITDLDYPSSRDREFNNQRFIHHLNFQGSLGKIPYNLSFSYQKQEKKLETYTFFIREDRKENSEEKTFQTKDVWFSRGTFSDLINTEKIKLQAGYEVTRESGFGSSVAIVVEPGTEGIKNTLSSYDVFTSAEIDFNDRFSIKPGVRGSFTNLFSTQMYYSTSARYLFNNDIEARAVLGFGTRTPEYDELYAYFVNINHDVRGNKDLNPEKGKSAFFHLKKKTNLSDEFFMRNKATFSYIDTKDRIELIVVGESPLAFQYNNIDEFTSVGAALENNFIYKNLAFNLGASFYGVSRIIDYDNRTTSNKQNNFQLNSSVTYGIPSIDGSLSVYYKYNGKTSRFIQTASGVYQTQKIDPYGWLDISFRKQFLNKKLETTIGARNILDVTNIGTNSVSGGAHSGNSNSISLDYGASYFLKLAYNINI